MSDRHDVATTLPWMREGTAHLLAVVEKLADDDLRGSSTLPGWTRAHVVGHVARNAEALGRLATWARTGEETPMYADRDQRAAEIERSAGLPASTLRAEVASTADMLDAALSALTAEQWRAPVRSALGRAVPAADVPWMRIREVWLHAVDLGTGASPDDLPAGVLDLLLDDVGAALSGKEGCPSLELAPTDRDRTWRLGTREPHGTVRASAADLAGWLTGRVVAPDRPALPRWL
ncbi:maleylpyruvate isomerase family mycothiol-dependent enzyme [Pseudonocardia yuanmonensis]|uniref:Maleylpyruvate isomerase family mycothiol-dependent enzyme n=1 Tax=Pseudonocardia yuanmonensis TaxID=1095914 RepID=A0ABP8XK70_9PSEU